MSDPFNPPDPGPEPPDPGPRPAAGAPEFDDWVARQIAMDYWVRGYRKAVLARARKELMAGAKPDAEAVRAALIVLFSEALEARTSSGTELVEAISELRKTLKASGSAPDGHKGA